MKNLSFGRDGAYTAPAPAPGRSCRQETPCVVTTVLHQFAESLGNAVDAKDTHTKQHSEEVAQVAHTLALGIGIAPVQADIIHVAGHLHDIGKIGIPDSILFKKGKLTSIERARIEEHPATGAAILRPVLALVESGVVDIILHHHERYDGGGYPHGLAGSAIPLGARIVAVADSLSAMLQNRPYRRSMPFAQASQEIARMSGTQFDPVVVSSFIKNGPVIRILLQALKPDQTHVA